MDNKAKLDAATWSVKVTICHAPEMPAFGGYLAGSLGANHPLIALNIDAFLSAVAEGDLPAKHLPMVLAETVAHEVIHMVEEWASLKFSERRVSRIIEKARKKHAASATGKGGPP